MILVNSLYLQDTIYPHRSHFEVFMHRTSIYKFEEDVSKHTTSIMIRCFLSEAEVSSEGRVLLGTFYIPATLMKMAAQQHGQPFLLIGCNC